MLEPAWTRDTIESAWRDPLRLYRVGPSRRKWSLRPSVALGRRASRGATMRTTDDWQAQGAQAVVHGVAMAVPPEERLATGRASCR